MSRISSMARFRRGAISVSSDGTFDDPNASTSGQQNEMEEGRRRSRSGSRLFLELSARRTSYFSKFLITVNEVV